MTIPASMIDAAYCPRQRRPRQRPFDRRLAARSPGATAAGACRGHDRDRLPPPARSRAGSRRPSGSTTLPKARTGVSGEDLEALKADIATAAIGGPAIERKVRTAGLDRVFEVRGGRPGRPSERHHAAVAVRHQRRRGGTGEARDARQTELALDLTHLIEAAPFPMWYRGPDLSLGLVNSAFVEAVEARDAAEVIARGSELIDAPGDDSARAGGAAGARERAALCRAPSRRPSAASGACCSSSTCRCRPARSPASRSTSRSWRTRASSWRGTVESQRELADRMTAGAAQFDADRPLSFLQPAVRGHGPARSRMAGRAARVRPRARAHARERPPARGARLPGLEGRAARLVHQRRRSRSRRSGCWPTATICASSPSRCPTAGCAVRRGPHRAGPAGLGARHLAARPRRDLRQSVRSDQRVRQRRAAVSVEPPLPRGLGARRGMARRASAGRRAGAGDGAQAGQSDRRRAGPRDGAPARRTTASPDRPGVDDRRPPVRVRRGAAARRQRACSPWST